ncbi:MAG: DinB family protein [Rubricoccaceae bacterium]|nr:DinB family protein [Rubricoccaceae bacterium]
MSSFSNPLRNAVGAADAYVGALLDVLGDQDPLDVLLRTPARLRDAVEGVPEAALRRPEAPGKWSVVAVVQHLADSELGYGYRIRLTVGQDRPAIPGYDQDAWAERLRYEAVRPEDALADFEALRTMNLRFLRALPDAAWARAGLHSERGEESVRRLTRLMAGHDLVHLHQVDRIKAAVAG